MSVPRTYLTEARRLLREREKWYIEAAYRAWTRREPVIKNGLRFMATNIGVAVFRDGKKRWEEVGSHSARAVEAAWLALNARKREEELVDDEDNVANIEEDV